MYPFQQQPPAPATWAAAQQAAAQPTPPPGPGLAPGAGPNGGPLVDPAYRAQLEAAWAAQFGGYPAGHPDAQAAPPDLTSPAPFPPAQPAAAGPPQGAGMNLGHLGTQVLTPPAPPAPGSTMRPLLGLLTLGVAAGVAYGIAKAIDTVVTRWLGDDDDVDQGDAQAAPHPHG